MIHEVHSRPGDCAPQGKGMSGWKQELVSIVMPAFNKHEHIEDSVRSVIAQTYPCWELSIVDDCSTDSTLAIARMLAAEDDRIRVLTLERNRGVAGARNAGIAASLGRYLAFLDADDLWMPEKLQVQLDFMRRSGCAFSHANYERFGIDLGPGKVVTAPPSTDYEQLLRTNCIGCLTVMLDREQIPEISMETIRHEDYVMWLRILKRGHSAMGIPRILGRYRVADKSLSSSKLVSATWTWNIYRRVERLPLWKAIACFTTYAIHAVWVRLWEGL
jgi:teichuronic acid biosynthesis glycosyltransferase TuaG